MEKKEQTFEDKINQSQEEFKRQFDPSSASFHGGIHVVVPTGGDRIPESMPTVYPQGFDPTKPQEVIDYGDAYRDVEASRTVFQNLKKDLAKLGPIVQAFLRH